MRQLRVLFWTGVLACCQDEISQRNDALFPVTPQTTWIYNVYDSLEKSSEKVEVKITATTRGGDRVVSQWQYSLEDGDQHVVYVAISVEKVEFFRDEDLSDLEKVMIVPLSVGNKWKVPGAGMSDVSQVAAKEDIESSGEVFKDTYEVVREMNSANYILKEDTWIQPGVGIVKMSVKEFNLAPVKNQYWELVTYDIQ